LRCRGAISKFTPEITICESFPLALLSPLPFSTTATDSHKNMSSAPQLADHFTFRVGHVDDVETIAANNIAMAKASILHMSLAVKGQQWIQKCK
jgi:hypothetical protein